MIKYHLHGRWNGHLLQPMMVHLPIALLALSMLCDLVSWIHPDHALVAASLISMSLAIITALVTAVPVLANFHGARADHSDKAATPDLIFNLIVVTLYTVNFTMRWSNLHLPRQGSVSIGPVILSVIGVAMIMFSSYLGELPISHHGISTILPKKPIEVTRETIFKLTVPGQEWIVVAPDNLQDGQTLRASINGQLTAIVKNHGEYFAIQEYCTHRCGPLSEGVCSNGKIVCPMHGSEFDLRSGKALKGPAKKDLKTWQVAVRDGQIVVRMSPPKSAIALGPIWQSEEDWETQQA